MSELSEADFKKIIARRDRRFDGRFFFGVKTTRIYCRSICPAKPKPENIRIFKSASEAEKHGYRACLRCRPDLAPGSKILDGTLSTVSRALRIIDDSVGDEKDIERLAESLGISDRHLRRLFDEHLGASPVEIMITQRLHFARQLIQSSPGQIAEIAYASGFQSIRRFNEAFRQRFRKSPSEMRKDHDDRDEGLILKIAVRNPYDWDTMLAYLSRHECYGIEQVKNGSYQRFISLESGAASITVTKDVKADYLSVKFVDVALKDTRFILSRVKHLFDTDHNPAHLPTAEMLIPNGIRVPGSFDPFETAIAVILSQLVSTVQAKAKLKQLVQRFGRKIATVRDNEVFEFPSAKRLSQAPIEEIGTTGGRAQAIRSFSKLVHSGEIDFSSQAEFSKVHEKLLAVKGIGPWTAAMISMRCLANPDAFPAADLIVQRAIEKKIVDHTNWSSSRAYLTHCLWRDYGAALSKVKHPKGNKAKEQQKRS